MSTQNLKLKVKKVIKETAEAVTIVLEKPAGMNYKAGQFLTVIVNVNGESLRRSYSLCSSPAEQDLAVTVKRVANGRASNFICDKISEGNFLECQAPAGVFTIEKAKSENIILIGAGSGITPLMGILKTALASSYKKVFLIFGNRSEDTIIFKSHLEQLKLSSPDKFELIHVLTQPNDTELYQASRLSQSTLVKILEGIPNAKADYFICGPEGMMEEAFKALDILKISKEKIHKESFVSAADKSGAQPVTGSSNPGQVTIIFQGNEYKIDVPANKTILEAALAKKIDLPHSCQSGLCTACMGKCTSGKIEMRDPDGLSDSEINDGYVLICVGRPVTPNVVIEVD